MVKKIRVGLLGGSGVYGWGGRAHAPAIAALPEYELVAVGTSRPETAAKAAQDLNAPYGYSDYRELIANTKVDLVSVSVKAPLHYEMTIAALEAGKPVFTEWPLGANSEEATKMTNLAISKGLPNIVGLQARVSPGLLHLKELIDTGYIGTPLSCSITMFLTGRERDSVNVWEGDRKQGGNVLTIHAGHSLDALAFCLGDFTELSSYLTTQVKMWHVHDTNEDELESLGLSSVIEKELHNINAYIKETKIKIENKVAPDVKVLVIPAYLESIIFNFVTKYRSLDRAPKLSFRSKYINSFVMLEIQDNGLGIDLEKHGHKLFGMYKTFHKHKEARGIGLFITKNQIEAMGGKIEVESTPNIGTTFKIFLKHA